MYKILFSYCDINCHHYFDISGITRTRSKHEYKIRPKVARTNYPKYSFFHRYIFHRFIIYGLIYSLLIYVYILINFFFFFLVWRVYLSMGIWFPPTTVLLTIFVFLFDCIC